MAPSQGMSLSSRGEQHTHRVSNLGLDVLYPPPKSAVSTGFSNITRVKIGSANLYPSNFCYALSRKATSANMIAPFNQQMKVHLLPASPASA